ncbi:splicing factor 3B subunit 6-like protein [Malus sylvestris]|uniref:splicing factor 3B subunit 6-like protein n=1 Tax=Malus sylvestris TaxID=3752 RepID=UPI0021AD0227|nr:splicing factor 3B subunit 6-like protein [Malus sylvestris]
MTRQQKFKDLHSNFTSRTPIFQVQTNSRHPVENSARKFSEIKSFLDSHGMQIRVKVNTRLHPEVNCMLYVRNLPFNISRNEMYDIFGKYGAIRQIRIETNKDTKGTAFFVYEDIYDAKTAVDHLSGFNVANRYLTVLYYQQAKMGKKSDTKKKEEEIAKMQEKYGVSTKDK